MTGVYEMTAHVDLALHHRVRLVHVVLLQEALAPVCADRRRRTACGLITAGHKQKRHLQHQSLSNESPKRAGFRSRWSINYLAG